MLCLKQLSSREHVAQYVKTFYDTLTRKEVEYLMATHPDIEKLNKHYKYIMLDYLKHNSRELICENNDRYIFSEFTINEIKQSLKDGPLRVKTWCILICLYRSGFGDEVFQKQYIDNISDEYIADEETFEICFKRGIINKLEPSLSNARKLKSLGITNVDLKQYFNLPEIRCDIDKYTPEYAKYLMIQYIINGCCPYNMIEYEDTVYDVRLDEEVIVQYCRVFKKNGIPASRKINLDISSTNGVMDIIDILEPECILEYYIETGKLKEYIQPCSITLYSVDTIETMERLIEMKAYIEGTYISVASDTIIQTLIKEGIKIIGVAWFESCTLTYITYIILLEYIDEFHFEIPDRLYRMDDIHKMVLYDKGTARLWNLRPSLSFLREIIKHSPTLFRKLIIPDHLKPFIDTSIKGFNHEFYGFYDIVIHHD